MFHLRILPISEKGFTAEAVLDGDELAVRFAGTADLTVKSMMDSFLCQANAEMCRGDLGAATVSMDIRGLESINSSCLMTVVTWITTVHEITTHATTIAITSFGGTPAAPGTPGADAKSIPEPKLKSDPMKVARVASTKDVPRAGVPVSSVKMVLTKVRKRELPAEKYGDSRRASRSAASAAAL